MRLYGDLGVAIATGVLTFAVLLVRSSAAENLRRALSGMHRLPQQRPAGPVAKGDVPAGLVAQPNITSLTLRLFGIRTNVRISDAVSNTCAPSRESQSAFPPQSGHADSALDLEKVTVNQIMVPRTEIVGIDVNDDWKSIDAS